MKASRFLFFATILFAFQFSTAGFDLLGKVPTTPRELSFEERVQYQRSIEEVYWQHRIWPAENQQPKPPLSAMMSEEEIRSKTAAYLRKSQEIEARRKREVTAEELQVELDRMATESLDPELLQQV